MDDESYFGTRLSLHSFLRDYWQKKPLVMKGVLKAEAENLRYLDFLSFAEKEETASRIIRERGGDYPWQSAEGPFEKKQLTDLLHHKHWNLLIQNLETMNDQIASLLDHFLFLPSWRLDDIMASVAGDKGSVGAHTDHYDVFIVQTQGSKLWKIATEAEPFPELKPDLDVQILKKFPAHEEYLLEPGDLLYLPPDFPHHGISRGNSISLSVGLRSPSRRELLSEFFAHILETLPGDEYYKDADLDIFQEHGVIDRRAIYRIAGMIQNIPLSEEEIARWFGSYITGNPGQAETAGPDLTLKQFETRWNAGEEIRRVPGTRLAYLEDSGNFLFYVNGAEFLLTPEVSVFARFLANHPRASREELIVHLSEPMNRKLLQLLMNRGAFEFR